MNTILEIPPRMRSLPRDKVGRPVPWFAASVGDGYDFRVVRPAGLEQAVAHKLCWVCGVPFQRQEHRAFVIGPMCAVNRVSSEPPSHVDCAVYSARACPFLNTPQMTRRDRGKPAAAQEPAGIMITRNPGVALVWVTRYRSWKAFNAGNGTLFDIGDPVMALWFARGREATRREVLESIKSGLPILLEMAEQEGPDAVAALHSQHQRALRYIPAEVPA